MCRTVLYLVAHVQYAPAVPAVCDFSSAVEQCCWVWQHQCMFRQVPSSAGCLGGGLLTSQARAGCAAASCTGQASLHVYHQCCTKITHTIIFCRCNFFGPRNVCEAVHAHSLLLCCAAALHAALYLSQWCLGCWTKHLIATKVSRRYTRSAAAEAAQACAHFASTGSLCNGCASPVHAMCPSCNATVLQ